jgi:hypothetical protein
VSARLPGQIHAIATSTSKSTPKAPTKLPHAQAMDTNHALMLYSIFRLVLKNEVY